MQFFSQIKPLNVRTLFILKHFAFRLLRAEPRLVDVLRLATIFFKPFRTYFLYCHIIDPRFCIFLKKTTACAFINKNIVFLAFLRESYPGSLNEASKTIPTS